MFLELDDAVLRPRRLMLHCLVVAVLSVALLSTFWYAGAPAISFDSHDFAHVEPGGHQLGAHAQAGREHAAPAKAHMDGQGCCHPACTMAVIPLPAEANQELLLSTAVRISPDLEPTPGALFAFDRPPKLT